MTDPMQTLMRRAVERVSSAMHDAGKAVTEKQLTQKEQLRRYLEEHQGRPYAMIDFAMANAPDSDDPLDEAVRYEKRMERLLAMQVEDLQGETGA